MEMEPSSSPSFIQNNLIYSLWTHSVFFSNSICRIFKRDIFTSNLLYLLIRKFMPFFKSTLSYRISYILFLSPCNKMIWVNTASHVAFMENQKTFRYLTYEKFIGYSMRFFNFTKNSKCSVTLVIPISQPKPASLSLMNMAYKSFFNVHTQAPIAYIGGNV